MIVDTKHIQKWAESHEKQAQESMNRNFFVSKPGETYKSVYALGILTLKSATHLSRPFGRKQVKTT